MSVRSWVTIDKIESIYDATIRDSTSSPYATRGGGHTRIEYEDMMQSGHAGRIKKWIKQNETDVWSPYLKHDIEKQSGGTRTILMPSFNVQLASSLYRRYYSNRLETPTCFYGLSQEAFDGATGVHAAVRRARDIQSQAWGIKVDIVDFFGSISDDLLEQSIHNDFCQDDVSLISRFMHLPVTTQDGDTFDSTFDAYGLPQGNPLSPILAQRSICDFPSCLDGCKSRCDYAA